MFYGRLGPRRFNTPSAYCFHSLLDAYSRMPSVIWRLRLDTNGCAVARRLHTPGRANISRDEAAGKEQPHRRPEVLEDS